MTRLTAVTGGEVLAVRGDEPQDPVALAERLRRLHRRGFGLHHDPVEQRFVCYFQISAEVPYQCYGELVGAEPESDEAFDEFLAELREVESEADWNLRTETGDSQKQEVFDALSAGVVTDPQSPSEVSTVLENAERPVELGTPDWRTAAGLYRWLRRQNPELRITICSGGRLEEFPPTDVIVVPGEAESVGVPVGRTWLRRARERRVAAVDEARTALQDALDAARSTVDSEHAACRRVVAAVGQAGNQGFEVGIGTAWDARIRARTAASLVLVGVSLGLLIGGFAALATRQPPTTVRLLTTPTWIGVPTDLSGSNGVRFAGPVPAWWLLCTGAGTIAAMTIGMYVRCLTGTPLDGDIADHARSARDALSSVYENELTLVDRRNRLEILRDIVVDSNRSLSALPGALDDSQPDGDRETFGQVVSSRVLEDLPFEVRSPVDKWRRRLLAGVLVIVGGGLGVAVLGAIATAASSSNAWFLLLNVVGLTAVIAVARLVVGRGK